MDDFTKIKLINGLIDVVERFYQLKDGAQHEDAKHLKGFCEGIAYTLIELKALSQEEVSKILKGMGKHREIPTRLEVEPAMHSEIKKEEPNIVNDVLPLQEPLVRTQTSLLSQVKKESLILENNVKSDDLDIPTFLRKNKP